MLRRLLFTLLLICAGCLSEISADEPMQPTADCPMAHCIYLPMAGRPAPPSANDCQPNAQEFHIALLLMQDAQQLRPSLRCNAILSRVARARALDMATRRYFSHTNPDGVGPNFLVEQAGYRLPDWWGNDPTANYIESIAAGTTTPDATWLAWMNSISHRTHLLGLDPFWAGQVEYGVGYVSDPNSPYIRYWVVLTAQPGP